MLGLKNKTKPYNAGVGDGYFILSSWNDVRAGENSNKKNRTSVTRKYLVTWICFLE